MTEPIVISVAKPLWTSWGADRKLARLSRPGLAMRPDEQLRDDLRFMEEEAESVKAEVVYGLRICGEDLPQPITMRGWVGDDQLYALGETPEEALENGRKMRAQLTARIHKEMERRMARR
ncbi:MULTISPECIES: hypothetical protein [Micromonospora]|uniref:hypothetical protein n=1 Tax=Micromonospora TaxID=1873 RepID=UPI0007DB4B7C|nr:MULTISPECIES: hypothetical protein [Micromonospora]